MILVSNMSILKIFTQHPSSVNETYFEHMRVAYSFSARLGFASLAAFIHAIFPFLFKTTASNLIKKLNAEITTR